MPSARDIRLQEFQNAAGGPQLSHEILQGAYLLLYQSLKERPRVLKVRQNHFSMFAPSVIILLTNAFDAWLNEQLMLAVFTRRRGKEFKKLADQPAEWEKYKGLCRLANIAAGDAKGDIRLLAVLRNEAVHYYPRSSVSAKYYSVLKKKGLTLPDNMINNHGFNNYATAFWVAETIQEIVSNLGQALSRLDSTNHMPMLDTSSNFRILSEILAPSSLTD